MMYADDSTESEARYRALAQASPSAILVSVGARLVYANDAAARLLRAASPRELVSRSQYELLAPDYRDLVRSRLRQVVEQRGSAPRVRYRWLRLDGTDIDVDVAAAWIPWQGEDAVQLVAHDITEEVLVEEALRESRATLADELEDVRRLQAFSARLIEAGDAAAIYRELLHEAVLLTQADAGSVQRFDAERGTLRPIAAQGFERAAATPAAATPAAAVDPVSVGGRALQAKERVLVGDVEACGFLAGTAELAGCAREGIHALQSTPLIARDGTPVGVLSTAWRGPLRANERQLRLLDVLARQAADLLERHQAQERLQAAARRQAFLLRLSDALRGQEDAAEIRRRACALLGEHLAADRVQFCEHRDRQPYVRVSSEHVRPGLVGWLGENALAPLVETQDELRAGHTVVVGDASACAAWPPSARVTYQALGIAAFVAAPLLQAGRLAWTLSVVSAATREWTAEEVTLIEEVAERASAAAERARAEQALKTSQAALQGFYDSSPLMMGIVEVRAETVVAVEVNEAAARFFGVREGRLHAPAGGDPDDANALWRAEFRRALYARAPVRFEYERRTPAGARWLSVIVVFVGKSPAGPLRYGFVAEDVTERKRVEQAVSEGEARRAFLVALDTALRPLTDGGDLQREVCRITRAELGADRVAYCEAGGDGALVVTAVDVVRGIGPGPGQVRIGEFGAHAAADLRAGHTVGCDDSAADTRGAAGPLADVRACLHAPIVCDGTVLALLTAQRRAPHAWTAAEAALLEDAAERTWAALTRSRAETALRDSEARLADLIEAMPVGVGLFDGDGRVVVANAEMRRWLPWSLVPSLDARAGPSRGRHPDGRRIEPADHPAARALRGERVVPGVEIVHALDDGSEVRTRVAATPTRDDDGRITGVIAVVTEIGARGRAAREEGERSVSVSAD